MPVLNLVILVLIVVAIVIILNRIFKKKNKLLDFNDGNVEQILPPSKIDTSTSSNYTYSIWFYVEDWNYKYGQQKVLLIREDESKNPCPKISLGAFENDLTVSLQTYSSANSQNLSSKDQTFNCTVKNVPIQSWVNALVSVNGRTLDVYLDGKLVKTCVMPGVARISGSSPIKITPNGGFSGYTANVEYWPHSTNPHEAWNIYRKGHGGSNIFNKYKIKVSVLENNKETASYQTGGK
jgi:hypothetical protein